jgi:acyl carrier protein
MKEIIEKIKNQFIDANEIEVFENTRFRDIPSYDSLTGMAILILIQDDYNIKIDDQVFKNLNTPKEIFELITEMKKV